MERRLHVFWPLTLIGAGVLWILIEIGTVPAANLWALTYLWPLLLVGAGIGLILRPYWQYASAAISALVVVALFLAVLFAPQLGWNRGPSFPLDGGAFFFGPATRGSGKVITQTRDVSDFSSLRVDYPASVLVRQGEGESLTIEAEDNVVAAISTKVVNGVLQIDSVRDHAVYVNPTRPVKITITVKDLKDVSFNSAGDLNIQALQGSDLKVTLDGAGGMKLDQLKLTSLDVTLGGAGSLQASGAADTLDVRLDGVGSFDGGDLHSQDASVNLNGLGSATVWAEKSLHATVDGLGSVNYFGNPTVNKTVDGLGTIHSMGTK